MGEIELGNLYDINKVNMAKEKPYDVILLNRKVNEMAEDIFYTRKSRWWMLLCRERYDYTIFHLIEDSAEFNQAILDCLTNRGQVLDITEQEDKNYEIWIRIPETEENVVYYLFNYENGVIEV